MPRHQRLLIRTMETLSGRGRLVARYRRFQTLADQVSGPAVWDLALDHLGARSTATDTFKAPARRPGQGLLLVANHPFGVADGVTLAWLASRLDPEFRVIANGVLRQEPALNGNILPIAFEPTREAMRHNVTTRRAAIRCLQAGGVVALFPAGSVSWAPKRGQPVRDDLWKPLAGTLIREGRADVLPIVFSGHNSPWFQAASRTALTLRLGLYLHEIRRGLDRPIAFQVKPVIPFEAIPNLPDAPLARWLQAQVIEEVSGSGIHSGSLGT